MNAARLGHLVSRFAGSLRARPLGDADVAWVHAVLTPGEWGLWARLARADRAESVAVARRVEAEVGDGVPMWIAAALLHDVGKLDAGLGSAGRVVATIVAGVAGHTRARRWHGRVGRYVAHDERGAALLRRVGARAPVAWWASAHHRPQCWRNGTIPLDACRVLAAADGQPTDAGPNRG